MRRQNIVNEHICDLYYYTKVDTMRYILTGENIFATNLLYMNDSEEYVNGLNEMRYIINQKWEKEEGALISEGDVNERLEQDVQIYSISFSTQRDLLSQWAMYSKESGVSLKMHFTGQEIYKDKLSQKSDTKNEKLVSGIVPKRVFYCTKNAMTTEQYDKVCSAIWKDVEESYKEVSLNDRQANALEIWRSMVPYVKRSEFSAEEEYRLVFDWERLLYPASIGYRGDKQVLKPYLDIQCENGWPIFEIMVGPGFNQDVVFRSILHFLNHQEIKVAINDEQYLKQCEEYLMITENADVNSLWREKMSTVNGNDRYDNFKKICKTVKQLKTKENSDFINKIFQKEFTRHGIILSKSGIPYIF